MAHHNRTMQLTNHSNLWDDSDVEDNRSSDSDVIEISPTTELPISSSVTTRIVRNLHNQQPSHRPGASASPVLILQSSARSTQQQQSLLLSSSARPAQQQQSLSSSARPAQQQRRRAVIPYVPLTLKQNSGRYHILPAFPTVFFVRHPPLLLPNVPEYKLNEEQLARREKDVYPLAYTINETNSEIPSYFRIEYHSFITSSINKYHVDGAIIDYNLDRMLVCFRIFAEDCIRRLKNKPEQFILNHIQKQIALEFYLQFDVDVFFMKTCSFRGAEPRSADEGLFCRDEPDARYGLFECGRCPLCKPLHNTMRYRQQPTIRFYAGYTHRFLNGYKSILNCDANCKTPNIIYVMTCPCGKFEYIGETGQRLNDRLWYHRKHANRIIHEFLIGEKNVELTRNKVKDFETNVKDRMLLYKHAARCPSTIQTFLNFNPTCSCFVPIPINEIDPQNERYSLPPSLMLLDRAHPTSIAPKDKNAIKATLKTRADELVRTCMRNLPYPPKGFGFSRRQRVEQYQYFKAKKDILPKLDQSVNLFNVAIIAVLPLNVSEVVRRFIEALFITHTEAKLNTFGRLCHDNDDDDNNNNNNEKNYVNSNTILGRGYWCRNIVFPH
ncbi:unnamed protein product [Adineta steineri]|uniref:GIY-YIG domain-containing protein n=1 Tax=Adineta steineri TaxID=433720 RepID=A0A819WV80_9BILA|nr:unnamed protein product [Adineta steineri]